MSRLTASPFTKPSALEFSRSTATPAETLMSDPFGHSQSMSVAGPPDLPRAFDNDSISSAQVADPGARFRRVSSLAYHSSGLRETRERSAQRNFKSFIIVIPPTSLVHEYGPLGHTLSSGPPHRLGQGLLMPLFPTMYGQLTAIAREFNFPSTAGLCIYLHHSDNGITFTPRISDDTWGQLWAPMAEGAHQAPGGLKPPICGRIEFDIDPQMARWYSSWLSSSQRNPVESMSQPINAHVRASSRTTYDSATVDEQHERPSRPRHIPRKLSLVDRFDVASVLTTRPPAGNTSMTPPEGTSTTALSPIYQTEEPLSAKVDLESRVRSWRASAKLEPTHLAAMGQTSLEPANMPNALPLEEVETFDGSDDEEPLRLEDFTWSISSKGPGSEILDSPTSVSYIQSVHIDARAAGSVCMTPSVCTSFGPSDYTLSPLSEPSFRIATPDLALRFYEDVPSTPSTATSWGPRSVDSYEYMIDEDDMISLDIGQRMVLSPPDSPCTTTSWGPGSCPPSPVSDIRAPSVDLGARGVFSCPPTPSTATSWGAPLSYPPSPSTPFYVSTPDAGARNFDIDLSSDVQLRAIHQSAPWAQVESPSEERGRMPWPHVWPYSPKRDAFVKGAAQSQSQVTTVNYPSLVIYAPLYPHFDLYPAPACIDIAQPARGGPNTVRLPISYNNFNLSGAVYPYNLNEIYPASKVVNRSPKLSSHTLSSASYPSLVIYAPVYPYLDLYPAPACANISVPPKSLQLIQRQRSSISTRLPTVYPNFNLYPALYPHNLGEIYGASPATESHIIDVTVASQYPIFNLYPAVYPYVTPYPSSLVMEPLVVNHIRGNSAGYPDFNLYPAVNKQSVAPIRSYGYPDFVLYEPIERQTVVQNVCRTKTFKQSPVKYGSQYPSFNLYPAVYPHFDLYPSVDMNLEEKLTAPVRIELGTMVYPVLQIYRPAYPYLELYPSLPEDIFHKKEASKYSYRSATAYPTFNLYPAVYPHFDLYPTVQPGKDVVDTRESSSQMTVQYPYFNLYPAVYPHFDLYPTVQVWKGTVDTKESSLQASVQYPFFNLYPAVYPHFDLYPTVPVWKARVTTQDSNFQASLAYPFFNLYPAVYPHFDLYPVAGPVIEPSVKLQCTVSAANVVYPYLTIYPAVYPHFDLWAAPSASRMQILVRKPQQLQPMAIQRKSSLRSPTRATSKAHLQLHNEVWLAEMMKGTQVKTSYPVVVPPVVPAVVPPVVIASPVAAAPVVAPPAVVPVIASPVVAPVAPSSAPAPAPLGPSPAAIRPSVQTSAPFQPVTTAPSPLRVRSRTSVAGLPASPSPPSRSLPPVTAPPPNRALPRRPDGSPSEASPVLRRSVAFDPRGPLPSRPDVHRVSSLNGRVGSMYASGRRGELPSLPVVDEALTRTNSLNVPPTQLGQQRELSRSQSVSSPNRPVHVRKRDSLVLQRVKAINSGYPAAGEERQHGRSLDMLDNFPAPPVHTRH